MVFVVVSTTERPDADTLPHTHPHTHIHTHTHTYTPTHIHTPSQTHRNIGVAVLRSGADNQQISIENTLPTKVHIISDVRWTS